MQYLLQLVYLLVCFQVYFPCSFYALSFHFSAASSVTLKFSSSPYQGVLLSFYSGFAHGFGRNFGSWILSPTFFFDPFLVRPDLQCSVHTGEVLAGNIGSPTRMKPGSLVMLMVKVMVETVKTVEPGVT